MLIARASEGRSGNRGGERSNLNQLMAIFGWLTEKEATRYTMDAQRRRLAASADRLLGEHRT